MMKPIHQLFRKPIWITEFAAGDWKAQSVAENQHQPATVLRFMEDVLPQLDRLDFIERYAWFPYSHYQSLKALGWKPGLRNSQDGCSPFYRFSRRRSADILSAVGLGTFCPAPFLERDTSPDRMREVALATS